MTARRQDITIKQGESKTINIPVVDTDATPIEEGPPPVFPPKDLSGNSVLWGVWLEADDPISAAVLSKTTPIITIIQIDGGGAVLDGISIPLLPADTQALSGTYHHEARVTAGSTEQVVTAGSFNVEESPTKD